MSDIVIRERVLKNGTVTFEYSFEIAPINGKRRRKSKSGFRSKREAKAAGKLAQQQYENTGTTIANKAEMSYSDYLKFWIQKDVATTCKDATVENYEKKIRLYISPFLGEKRLRSIVRQDIKDFLEKMYDDGFSKNTISVCKGIITKSFDYAVDSQILSSSPATGIKRLSKGGRPPKNPTRTSPHVYIPKEQMDQIFERFPCGTSPYLSLMTGYHCGTRLGESYAIVEEDIDFVNKKLKLNRQIQWKSDSTRTKEEIQQSNGSSHAGNGYWYFTEPKYRSYRIINLDDDMIELLSDIIGRRKSSEKYYGSHYVHYYVDQPLLNSGVAPETPIPDNPLKSSGKHEIHLINIREDGSFITPRTMQHTATVIQKQLGIKDFDYHSLRHTHSTMLLEMGAPDVYIQRRLGHTSSQVTKEVYTNHLTPAIQNKGLDVLQNLY